MSWTFTTLKSAIQDYTQNTESTFVADLGTIIKQAEDRIVKSVELPNFRKNQTGSFTSGNQYLSTPSDYLYPFSLAVLDSDSAYTYLLSTDVSFIREAYPSASSTGVPKHYAQFDDNTFIIAPSPDAAYEVELHYYHRPASLTTTSGSETTWLSKNAPNTLLYGSLVEACTYLKNYEAIPAYEEKFQDALLGLKNLGEAKSTRDQNRYDEIRREPQA